MNIDASMFYGIIVGLVVAVIRCSQKFYYPLLSLCQLFLFYMKIISKKVKIVLDNSDYISIIRVSKLISFLEKTK